MLHEQQNCVKSNRNATEYGNRIPMEIRHQFQDLLHDSFLIPSLTHYLR